MVKTEWFYHPFSYKISCFFVVVLGLLLESGISFCNNWY
uniref:Uncharacterized protein n=1 Tax=Myoviridae sp. ctLEM34 TaxID=2825082 RepID=A0A8S5TR88_9CAUD|nr:MAG TPA: hypothetical protein [Myoviridae sp. ctLEM34]DAV55200.1 MAG TPA: hypothetical protein [Caudoviricetes sp.]